MLTSTESTLADDPLQFMGCSDLPGMHMILVRICSVNIPIKSENVQFPLCCLNPIFNVY